jgi:hypothetical protein
MWPKLTDEAFVLGDEVTMFADLLLSRPMPPSTNRSSPSGRECCERLS